MGVHYIAADKKTLLHINSLFTIHDLDSPSTTCSYRLNYIKLILVFGTRPILLQLTLIVRQDKAKWWNVEVFYEFCSESIDVLPKKIFSAESSWSGKMVCLLIHVQSNDFLSWCVASPLKVKIRTIMLKHGESSTFTAVNDCIVNVSVVCNLEAHKDVFVFISFQTKDPLWLPFYLDVTWILKECSWRSIFEHRL